MAKYEREHGVLELSEQSLPIVYAKVISADHCNHSIPVAHNQVSQY